MGFFGRLVELGKDLGEIARDGSRELREISTDGFKEMVIKGNSNYKTSYEKRDEARYIAAVARSNYEEVYEDVKSTYDRVSRVIEDHYSYKANLLQKIQTEYAPTVQQYIKKFQMKKKDFELAQAAGTLPLQSSSMSKLSGMSGALVGISGMMQRQRITEADDMLDDAKELRARLDMECEKLKRLKSNLQVAEKAVKEEKSLIDRLLLPLQEKIEETDKLLHSFFKKKEQVTEAESAIKIITLLERTLSTQFLQDEAAITKQYQDVTNQLLALESQLQKGAYSSI